MKFDKFKTLVPTGLRDTRAIWIDSDIAAARGDLGAAAQIYRHIVKRTPKDAQGYQYLALAHLRLGQEAQAAAALEAGMRKLPDADPALMLDHYVRLAVAGGDLAKVIALLMSNGMSEREACAALVARQFGQADVQLALLVYCIRHGLIDEALAIAAQAGGGHDMLAGLWELGDVLLQQDRGDDAARLYRQIAGRVRTNSADYFYAGLAEYRLNRHDAALDVFESAFAHFPAEAGGYLFDEYMRIAAEAGLIARVIGQRMQRDGGSAQAVCAALIEAPDVSAHVLLPVVRYCIGHALPALAERGLQLAARFSDLPTCWAVADVWLELGRQDAADAIYRAIEQRQPESKLDFYYVAMAAYRLKQLKTAVAVLEAGLAIHPFEVDDYLFENYFRIASELGELARVIAFRQAGGSVSEQQAYDALFLAPAATAHIRTALIGHSLKHGMHARAEAGIAYVRSHHDDSAALWLLADVLFHHDRAEQAQPLYRILAARVPETELEFYYAAMGSYRLKQIDTALDVLESGLRRFPSLDQGYLFENYLRLVCEAAQLERAIDFIRAVNGLSEEQAFEFIYQAKAATASIRVGLIGYCLRRGWQARAAQAMQAIYDHPEDRMSMWMLADLLLKHNRRSEEEAIYRQLAAQQPDDADAYYYASAAELRLGNTERCLQIAEDGQRRFPDAQQLSTFYVQICASVLDFDRYYRFKSQQGLEGENVISSKVDFFKYVTRHCYPETFVVNYKDIQASCDAAGFAILKDDFLDALQASPPPLERAKVLLFFSRYIDAEPAFCRRLLDLLQGLQTAGPAGDKARHALRILYDLTPPMIPHYPADQGQMVEEFIANCHSLAASGVQLEEPMADMIDNWTPWQYIFCLARPELYHHAFAAFEKMALASWPRLDFTSPHVAERLSPARAPGQKIRIGFTVHESMPMMSGLMAHLDTTLFETVYLRPGRKGASVVGDGWIARAGETVEYSDVDAYAAIETISAQQLDILISGPAMAAIFYPMMARLAPLQMILLEPNWTDGFTNSDYYISWQRAEPPTPGAYYKSAVALLEHPPYWIERPAVGSEISVNQAERDDVRRRLLGCGPESRVYLCANTLPKIHPLMDDIFYELLERDPTAKLVMLRGDYPPGKSLKLRLREKLGPLFDRIVFLKTLTKNDAHMLLQSADCSLDSYPLCGMSSSFDGMMLGVPIVTLPSNIPFGNWTAAIYDYMGVGELTATDRHDYVDKAIRLASDKQWRASKSAEIQEKSGCYVESTVSADEFQHFLLQAWKRKLAGLPAANWMSGRWQ